MDALDLRWGGKICFFFDDFLRENHGETKIYVNVYPKWLLEWIALKGNSIGKLMFFLKPPCSGFFCTFSLQPGMLMIFHGDSMGMMRE